MSKGPKGLKSRLTSYGDAGFALFLRQAFLKSAGYTDEVLDRPVVGIGSTASDFNPCHATAPQVIEAVKRGVLAAGGIPFVFPTISLHESFCSPTTMLLRNLMAIDVEEMLRAQPLDAAVLIGGCDKTVPAQIMGALSADVPTLIEVVGAALAGMNEGERLGACTDCRRLWYMRRANEITDQQLEQGHGRLIASHGTCTVMGTASTMACFAEILGLMLPGGASIPAVHAERLRHAEATGMRAVEMAKTGSPSPRALVTKAAIRNAMVVLAALGGSTNAVIHLAAIAGRVGIEMSLDELDQIGRTTPVLTDLKPVGQNYMEDFHAAGGLPSLLRQLGDKIDTSAMTAAGDTIADMLKRWLPYVDEKIIRPLSNPVSPGEALTIVRGNLAPDGAVIKRAAADAGLMQHKGPALVFEGLEDMAKRIDDPNLPVTKDTVMVLRNIGPIGAPGMPEAGGIPIPKKLAQAGVKDMVRVSDARMSGTAYGAIVLHVAPEAAVGGPLALVKDGDMIELDVAKRAINMLVDEKELERRRAAWKPPASPKRGYHKLYAQHVMQADKGCDFDFLQDEALQG